MVGKVAIEYDDQPIPHYVRNDNVWFGAVARCIHDFATALIFARPLRSLRMCVSVSLPNTHYALLPQRLYPFLDPGKGLFHRRAFVVGVVQFGKLKRLSEAYADTGGT